MRVILAAVAGICAAMGAAILFSEWSIRRYKMRAWRRSIRTRELYQQAAHHDKQAARLYAEAARIRRLPPDPLPPKEPVNDAREVELFYSDGTSDVVPLKDRKCETVRAGTLTHYRVLPDGEKVAVTDSAVVSATMLTLSDSPPRAP